MNSVTTTADIKVSIAEVCEVRGCGLDAAELLALAASAAESLPPCPKGTVFDPENIFVSCKGNVVIHTVPTAKVSPAFVPPEWEKGENNEGAAAVYCMGAVLRACGAEEAADVDLFSLVNILTVAMVGTRPTANRMAQMAKNQLRGRDARSVLLSLYEEIMGDEESNQIPDDMEFDDLSEDDRPVSASALTVTKKAVDFFDEDDEKESRAASASTSSGNSTQKDSSHFGDDIEVEEIHEQTVPSPIPPPRSPRSFNDSLNGIGSPIGNSTRLNDTFVEEHSIDMSFNRAFEDNFVSESSISVKVPEKVSSEKRPSLNPFDDVDSSMHGGTLSGRDPFEEVAFSSPVVNKETTLSQSSQPAPKEKVVNEYRDFSPKPVLHRFSSSDDDIVEANLDDEDLFRPVKKTTTTSSSQEFVELSKQKEYDSTDRRLSADRFPPPSLKKFGEKSAVPPEAPVSAVSSRHNSSTLELDRLKEETDRLRAEAGRLAEETSEMETQMDDARSHVDVVVITADQPLSRLSTDAEREEDGEPVPETPIDTAFREAIKEKRYSRGYVEPVISPITDSPQFERRNSLVPARVSGRHSTRSLRGKRKTRAIPEFFDNARHPSIRLRAPSAKKKKLTLMRVEQSEVQVELLNGQRVEVSCRTDALARDIFSMVVQHMNINEHVFFGLSFMRDKEHYFLEDHQKLEKFAPPGWKAGSRGTQQRQPFILYLRFRFYPQILDFIKTEVTMHELYLQVRHDVIDDRIQPKRDAAFELAALALQAEFGNRPPPVIVDYFDNSHYLPKRFCSNDDPKRLQSVLSDLHSQYSNTKGTEAEHKFIQICQRHSEFGAHLHRVFRSKPSASVGATPFDPDTGAALWISIMPRGISVYEEQAGLRERLAEHQWPDTQTLQFDKKKFVIISIRDGNQVETVFYTDHHSKSSYFVKFSASQHRFMMKMRQWKTTLRHENTMQALPDVAVEGSAPPHPVRDDSSPNLEEVPSMFPRMPPAQTPVARAEVLDVSIPSHDRTDYGQDETVSNSLLERFEAASHPDSSSNGVQGMRFDVTLVKNPSAGLGLTLVDGNLNGVKGVYVKSVAENGAGMRAGLSVGDRLLSVEGVSLEGGDRHRAVELVKTSGGSVRLEISRLDGVVRHEKTGSSDYPKIGKTITPSNGLAAPTPKGGSRTPPAPRRAANRRQRAVSDFGAIGDTLPALDSDNVINIKAISGLHLDESDEERGEYRLPTASMYSFDNHYDDEAVSPTGTNNHNMSPSPSNSSPMVSRGPAPSSAEGKKKNRYQRKSNLDWTEELEEVGEEEDDGEVVYVSLNRNSVGSLGVQIASTNGRVCVKQLTAEPATSNPNIRVGMQILYVNGKEVTGCSHQEVVSMLRNGDRTVVLGLKREEETGGNVLSVTLEKQPQGSLGISLAKRTGTEGIFIRTIAEDSAAANEGSLRVGDRLLSIDDQSVEGLSPTAILARLKVVIGAVKLTVSR